MQNLNQKILQNVPVPVCSLSEQAEIMNEINRQFSAIENNLVDLDKDLSNATCLRQSILKKAFSGQLVKQDPNDEPASVLLERIKAGKIALQNLSPGKNTAKRKAATA